MTGRPNVVVGIDLDDTLYPEMEYARSALKTAGNFLEGRLRAPGIAAGALALLESGAARQPLQASLAALGLECPATTLDEAVRVMWNHAPTIEPFSEVPAALEQLRRMAVLVLVTEGRSPTQRAKLKALGLERSFDQILITSELPGGAGKSGGAPYRHLRGLHPRAAALFMIGDNAEKDGAAPQREGFRPVLVRRADVRLVHPFPDATGCVSTLSDAVDRIARAIDGSVTGVDCRVPR